MTWARNQFLFELDPNQQSYIPPSNTLRDNQSHFIFICATSELAVFVNLKPRATQVAMFVTLLCARFQQLRFHAFQASNARVRTQ
jgi:hypothetical protein